MVYKKASNVLSAIKKIALSKNDEIKSNKDMCKHSLEVYVFNNTKVKSSSVEYRVFVQFHMSAWIFNITQNIDGVYVASMSGTFMLWKNYNSEEAIKCCIDCLVRTEIYGSWDGHD